MDKKDFIGRVFADNPNCDFTNTVFINIQTPIEVVCTIHGLFKILPSNMLYKHEGCKFCGIEKMAKSKSLTRQEFIKRAKKIHGDKFDYSLTNYKNNKTPIKITCKNCGKTFEQLPCNHLKGFGCKCCES